MSGGLFYTMGLNPAQFIGGMQRAQNAMTGFKGGMGGLLGMATKLVGAFAAIGAGAGVFMAVKKGLQLAADFEKTEVGMDTIIKNLRVTRGLVQELQALGKRTPLELPELTGGARQMLGAGWNIGAITKDLEMFGDVAAGAQTDVAGLITVVSQVKGKGKLMAEELQQLAERGVAGLREELAKVKGVSVAELMKEMEAGNVVLADLMQAFRNMTSQGGMFFKAMENQSKTTYGLLSTLRDAVDQIYLAFSLPINDAIKPVLQSAIERADILAAKGRQVVAEWQVAWEQGQLGELLYEQGRVGLAKLGNYAVSVFAGMREGVKAINAGEAFNFLSDKQLWLGGVNLLELGLQKVAMKFGEAMFGILQELNKVLPRAMKMDDDNLQANKELMGTRSSMFGTAMNVQLREITRYFEKLEFGDRLMQGIKSIPKAFADGMRDARKVFNENPSQAAKDIATVARIQRNNEALKNKTEFQKAAEPPKLSKPSPLDYLKGKGLDAMKNMVKPGASPLDYLQGRGVGTGYQRSMTLRERELQANGAGSKVVARVRSRREKEDSESKTMVRHLSQIATNTSKLQVV
jgi:tape measure domain-containing protein